MMMYNQLIISLSYAGFVLWVVEGWTNESGFPKKSNVDQMRRTVFNMTASFVGGNDHRYSPHTTAGRVTILAASFAVLVRTKHIDWAHERGKCTVWGKPGDGGCTWVAML